MTTRTNRSRTRWLTSLAMLLASSACAPSPTGECAVDEDCEAGEVCRALQESEERVCIRPFTQSDAGPSDEEPVVIESLTADDEVVPAGGTTTLRWSAQHASSCAFNEGIGGVDDSGSVEVTVARTTAYTLSCQGVDGPALQTLTVAVEVSVLSLSLDQTQANIGAELTLSWTSIGATSCVATAPGLSYEVPAADLEAGETAFTPTQGGDATLTCEGASGLAVDEVAFEVARIASFTATPATVSAGGTSTLAWVGESVTGCAVDDVIDDDGTDAEVTVTVNESTDYTLTCSGFAGADIQATASVTVE